MAFSDLLKQMNASATTNVVPNAQPTQPKVEQPKVSSELLGKVASQVIVENVPSHETVVVTPIMPTPQSTPTKKTTSSGLKPNRFEQLEVQQPEIQKAKPIEPVKKNVQTSNDASSGLYVEEFGRELKKAELWFGNPGTGKTVLARRVCERFLSQGLIDDYVVIDCHEDLSVMNLLKTTKTDDENHWKFLTNRFFNMLTDSLQKKYVVVLDEANTMPMSTMKSTQPLMDDTVGHFEFEEKRYEKNPNVFFILTENHNDIGISTLPDAVLDRLFPVEFEDLSVDELSRRSGVPASAIQTLEKIRNMFAHLGNLPEFHKSVRKLKNIVGLSKEQVQKYITSELSLAHIEWKEAVAVSPEFKGFIEEFAQIEWKKRG